ncbi:hypothetical protein BJ742DRAFT_833567 [Cladochytrium replicatum]|nr:hypothetical protein BJ742DRAFT_833567 [Cladochytrium replicatum]
MDFNCLLYRLHEEPSLSLWSSRTSNPHCRFDSLEIPDRSSFPPLNDAHTNELNAIVSRGSQHLADLHATYEKSLSLLPSQGPNIASTVCDGIGVTWFLHSELQRLGLVGVPLERKNAIVRDLKDYTDTIIARGPTRVTPQKNDPSESPFVKRRVFEEKVLDSVDRLRSELLKTLGRQAQERLRMHEYMALKEWGGGRCIWKGELWFQETNVKVMVWGRWHRRHYPRAVEMLSKSYVFQADPDVLHRFTTVIARSDVHTFIVTPASHAPDISTAAKSIASHLCKTNQVLVKSITTKHMGFALIPMVLVESTTPMPSALQKLLDYHGGVEGCFLGLLIPSSRFSSHDPAAELNGTELTWKFVDGVIDHKNRFGSMSSDCLASGVTSTKEPSALPDSRTIDRGESKRAACQSGEHAQAEPLGDKKVEHPSINTTSLLPHRDPRRPSHDSRNYEPTSAGSMSSLKGVHTTTLTTLSHQEPNPSHTAHPTSPPSTLHSEAIETDRDQESICYLHSEGNHTNRVCMYQRGIYSSAPPRNRNPHDPNGRCHIHPHTVHTNAECRNQRGKRNLANNERTREPEELCALHPGGRHTNGMCRHQKSMRSDQEDIEVVAKESGGASEEEEESENKNKGTKKARRGRCAKKKKGEENAMAVQKRNSKGKGGQQKETNSQMAKKKGKAAAAAKNKQGKAVQKKKHKQPTKKKNQRQKNGLKYCGTCARYGHFEEDCWYTHRSDEGEEEEKEVVVVEEDVKDNEDKNENEEGGESRPEHMDLSD